MYRLKRYKSEKLPRYSYMTKFEKARIIGDRANQIATDPSKPCVVLIGKETDVQKLAEKELKENVIPEVIRRTNNDGEYEDWVLDEDQETYKDLI